MKAKRKVIAGQPSWVLANRQVELAVTELGGHMAPVTFHRDSPGPVQPYFISSWQGEKVKLDEPVLVPLRGDFFCLPFGAPDVWHGVRHVCHGEPATGKWTMGGVAVEGRVARLTMTMQTVAMPGKVTKRLSLIDGHNVVYCQHVLEGFSTQAPLGHHATLALPDRPGALRVATSPFKLGMTNPTPFGDPAIGHYQSLAINRKFIRLDKVPLMWKEPAFGDCSRLPSRTGFTDLLGVWARHAKTPAWTTATVQDEGFLWFSLKDPAMLPATLLWISNRGRHSFPWDGRNLCLGLEDVCAYFANTPAESAERNMLNNMGIETVVKLSKSRPTTVNYIQGVVKVPPGFECVRTVNFGPGTVMFTSVTGKNVTAPVCHEFLATGQLE
jgi:hypothetical protein